MAIGDILKRIGDDTAKWWGKRLGDWMASWVMGGVNAFLSSNEPEAINLAQDTLKKVHDDPNTPPDIRALIDKLMAGTHPIPVVIIVVLAAFMVIPMITSISAPLGRLLEYVQDRGLGTYRLDPMSIITAWRRDPDAYEKLFGDLRDLGWTDERIEALKFFTLFYPAPADLIRWQAREVFEPEMIERYGLDSEFEAIEKAPFYKAGMTDEQILNYWRAHWEHASWMQVVEMLHRDLLTEEQVWDWFRVVEIPPFWRQPLIDSAYTWPTRVDVRRWWDMRTIDETELRRLYSGMGYRGVNLDNYVLWTKVYVAFPDLMARWTKGWITEDEVKAELTRLGMPAERVEEMIQTKIGPEKGERVAGERELTKTDIIKGVKKEVISWGEGIELLMDLGYDEDEADYILTINIAAATGSPETMEEFRDITQKYRKAIGRPSKPVPEELKKAAARLVEVTKEVESLREAVEAEGKTLIEQEVLPAEATAKVDELTLALHRAESELARVQTDYNTLVARWKFEEEK